jgi:hypothetical protein
MFPKINISRNLKNAFNYNECKLSCGKSELIHAANFLKLPHQMDKDYRWNRFEKLMLQNERVQRKATHISLSFHSSEQKKLSNRLLINITDEYMKRIGFEKQPYLVYRHHDTGHPHVHIVSTLIRPDGSSLLRINFWHSENVCKELEKTYGLVPMVKREQLAYQEKKPEQKIDRVQKLKYGKDPAKPGISAVLDLVLREYKFTSIGEFNALLKQYNVLSVRGKEGSRMYQRKGLIYRILDEQGDPIGMPIKASSLDSKPTLMNLEKKFLENDKKREPDLRRLKIAIDWTLVKPQKTLREFVIALEKEGVSAVVVLDRGGRARGFTYVDYNTRSAFDESGLGHKYTAAGLLERLGLIQENEKSFGLSNTPADVSSGSMQAAEPGITKEKIAGEENRNTEYENRICRSLEMILKPDQNNEELVPARGRETTRKKDMEYSREI